MKSHEEIMSTFMTQEMSEKLEQIDQLDDFEQQGYEVAASIAEAAGLTSEQLLQGTVSTGEPGPMSNVLRTIGLIRWCLDQRRKG